MPNEKKTNEKEIPTIKVNGAFTIHRKDDVVVTLFYENAPVAKLEITPDALDQIVRGLQGPPIKKH